MDSIGNLSNEKTKYSTSNACPRINTRYCRCCCKGEKGDTPYIGENGNWWIGDTDTGVTAQGPAFPLVAGSYATLANPPEVHQDQPMFFPNGWFSKGMSMDSAGTTLTLDISQYYRITFLASAEPISGNPHFEIQFNGQEVNNPIAINPNGGGTTTYDLVLPIQAGTKLQILVREGSIKFWNSGVNQVGAYLNVVGYGMPN